VRGHTKGDFDYALLWIMIPRHKRDEMKQKEGEAWGEEGGSHSC
jgi:hypothetical protein